MTYIPAIREEQYPASDETQCISVIIPAGDEFKWLLAGLLGIPARLDAYVGDDEAQVDGLVATWDDAYSQIDWSGCTVANGNQDRILLPAIDAKYSNGTSFTAGVISSSVGLVWYQTTPLSTNIGKIDYIPLRAGAWKATFGTMLTSASAKLDIYLKLGAGDPISMWSLLDLYNSTSIVSWFDQGGFTISEDGLYTLYFDVNGKNASSSNYNYYLLPTAISLFRTGD